MAKVAPIIIGKIVNDIRESDHPQNYVDAIMLMTEKTLDEIRTLSSEERLELFISGMVENKIVQLKSFCDGIGFSNGWRRN